MSKKMTVLAMALGVVVAMALPATASATWKHAHSQTGIQQNVEMGLTGDVGFQSETGGISCQVSIRARFFAGQTTGQLETYVPHPTNPTTNCTTSGGLGQCEVETVQPTNLPWTFHTTGTVEKPNIQVKFGDIHTDFIKKNLFCPFEHSTWTAGSMTFQPTPTDGVTVTSFHASGKTQGHPYSDTANPQGLTTNLVFSGTLSVEEPNFGTCSI